VPVLPLLRSFPVRYSLLLAPEPPGRVNSVAPGVVDELAR
jgi:hypothetical protein